MNETEILALYEWASGTCFRCAGSGVDTCHIRSIPTNVGPLYDIRACKACIADLEKDRRQAAERAGQRYVPGTIGS